MRQINQQNYNQPNYKQMQFPQTWDSKFNKLAQGLNINENGLYQSQLYNQNYNKYRCLGLRIQQCRNNNTDQLVKQYENYTPISSLINLRQLKAKTAFTIKKYKQSLYFGEFIQGKRSGLGVMLYTNQRIYQGYWNDNFKHGKGYEKFANGARYFGIYAHGKPEGYGTYSWENGEIYEGQWLDGVKNGSGIWRGHTGDSYIGQWKNGQANGYGVHTWINGDRYEGQFKDCLKHGQCLQRFANGDSYKGTYVMGKPQGYGQYYWGIGSNYKGEFKNGMRHGRGVWKHGPNSSQRYQGQYKHDRKQGDGVFIWQNGNLYKGNFSNDLRSGYGQMYWIDRKVFKGQWLNNQQIGGSKQFYQPIVQQFSDKNIQNNSETQQFYNQNIQNKVTKIRFKNKKKQNQFQYDEFKNDFFQFNSGYFHQQSSIALNSPPKKFRAREFPFKKQQKAGPQKSTRPFLNNNHNCQQSKFIRKYSLGSRCSTNRKIKPRNSQNKMLSSTFYLYKIHSKSPALEQRYTKPKQRQVKSSGAMRSKNISQQIKYFTRNKFNSEFL